ncbi:MAG: alpha/beta hydrolase, partial [Gemmatimonadota bacterium]|nr:alpha/beta hydrolase [Gemmatimonadota bacterium]
AVGVLRASTDARIQQLISLAGMVDTKGFAQREFGDVTPDEGNMWDDPDCPLSSAYMDDLTAIDTVIDRASQISAPYLLVHGTEDDVVPIEDSQTIFEQANEPKELVTLNGADHVFSDDATPAMIQAVINWIAKQEY